MDINAPQVTKSQMNKQKAKDVFYKEDGLNPTRATYASSYSFLDFVYIPLHKEFFALKAKFTISELLFCL